MGLFSSIVANALGKGDEFDEAVFGRDASADERVLDLLTPEQQNLLQEIIGEARAKLKPSAAEQDITQAVLDQIGVTSAGSDLDRAAEERLTQIISGTDESTAELFEQAVAAPLREEFESRILPQIRLQFGGNFSSGRALATGEAGAGFADQLIRARAQFQLDQQQQQLQALGLVPSFQQGDAGRLSALVAALQGVTGAEATRQAARQNLIGSALGTRAFENVLVTDPGRPGFLEAAAPGIGQGLIGLATGTV